MCFIDSSSKILYTPGPVMTTLTVKQAMMRDIGTAESEFKECIKFSRKNILEFAGVTSEEFAVVIMQGSGTYSLEAVIAALSNENSKLLIIENGLYGRNLRRICGKLNVKYDVKSFPENRSVNVEEIEEFLKQCQPDQYTAVGMVHGETSTGALNRVDLIGPIIKKYLPSK